MHTRANTLTETAPGLPAGPAAAPAETREGREAALLRKIDELERFAYVAAHDLQEPLRMVAGYTQLLAERYGDTLEPPAGEFLAFAMEGARRMQDLVDGLLLLACGDPDVDTRRTASSAEAVSTAVANLRLAIEESHATVRLGNLPGGAGRSGPAGADLSEPDRQRHPVPLSAVAGDFRGV